MRRQISWIAEVDRAGDRGSDLNFQGEEQQRGCATSFCNGRYHQNACEEYPAEIAGKRSHPGRGDRLAARIPHPLNPCAYLPERVGQILLKAEHWNPSAYCYTLRKLEHCQARSINSFVPSQVIDTLAFRFIRFIPESLSVDVVLPHPSLTESSRLSRLPAFSPIQPSQLPFANLLSFALWRNNQ